MLCILPWPVTVTQLCPESPVLPATAITLDYD